MSHNFTREVVNRGGYSSKYNRVMKFCVNSKTKTISTDNYSQRGWEHGFYLLLWLHLWVQCMEELFAVLCCCVLFYTLLVVCADFMYVIPKNTHAFVCTRVCVCVCAVELFCRPIKMYKTTSNVPREWRSFWFLFALSVQLFCSQVYVFVKAIHDPWSCSMWLYVCVCVLACMLNMTRVCVSLMCCCAIVFVACEGRRLVITVRTEYVLTKPQPWLVLHEGTVPTWINQHTITTYRLDIARWGRWHLYCWLGVPTRADMNRRRTKLSELPRVFSLIVL